MFDLKQLSLAEYPIRPEILIVCPTHPKAIAGLSLVSAWRIRPHRPLRPRRRGRGESESGTAILTAGATAAGEVPNSTVTSLEHDKNGWEATVVTADGTEDHIDLDAKGNDVRRGPTKERDDPQEKAQNKNRAADAKIDYRTAIATLLKKVRNGRITELNLDSEGGKTIWEADVLDTEQHQHEIQLEAQTGEVLRDKVDD